MSHRSDRTISSGLSAFIDSASRRPHVSSQTRITPAAPGAVVTGTNGPDTLLGSVNDDTLNGLNGDDGSPIAHLRTALHFSTRRSGVAFHAKILLRNC
jgi:hypothetical protein